LLPDIDIPRPPESSVASDSAHGSRSHRSRRGPPSIIDTSDHVDPPPSPVLPVAAEIPVPPDANVGAPTAPVLAAPTFRGLPVDIRPSSGYGPPAAPERFRSPTDPVPPAHSSIRRQRPLPVPSSPARPLACTLFRLR
jgi:hypothetical protein